MIIYEEQKRREGTWSILDVSALVDTSHDDVNVLGKALKDKNKHLAIKEFKESTRPWQCPQGSPSFQEESP